MADVMDLLRESTSELHNSAEANEFQHQLGSGKVDKGNLSRYLQQLYLMHRTISRLIVQAKPANNALSHVVQDYHLDNTCILNDLAYFGSETDNVEPLQATAKLIESMNQTAKNNAAGLLGYLYVLEGSTNGAKFIAKALKNGLALPEEAGATYFDRYGDKQRQRWMAFKQAMNELDFSETERAELVENARETFSSFGRIGEELLSKS